MNNETLKRDLCARIPNNPLMQWTREEDKEIIQQELNLSDAKFLVSKRAKLILFPTSALTKPIQIASYNNGEPFVPIEKIKEETMWCDAYDEWWFMYQDMWVDDCEEDIHNYMIDNMKKAPFEVIEKLNQWHINYRLSAEQFIEVTDEFNPYK